MFPKHKDQSVVLNTHITKSHFIAREAKVGFLCEAHWLASIPGPRERQSQKTKLMALGHVEGKMFPLPPDLKGDEVPFPFLISTVV